MSGTLLYIEASPRRSASVSSRLAEGLVELVSQARPDLEVDRLNVWEEALPELDGALLAAKYAVLAKRDLDDEQVSAWTGVEALIERLRRSSGVVLATPMWNFGIPYKLKHWMDLVTQPGLSFAFDPQSGYRPLLEPRPATIVLASSGDYSQGPSWGRPDLASDYLRQALHFIGISDTEIILAGPTTGSATLRAEGQARARAALETRAAAYKGVR